MKTKAETMGVKLFIDARPPRKYDDESMKRGYALNVDTFDAASASKGRINIMQTEVTIQIPAGVDIVTGMVESLRTEQSGIRAEAERQCQEIEATIQNMLCIEHDD